MINHTTLRRGPARPGPVSDRTPVAADVGARRRPRSSAARSQDSTGSALPGVTVTIVNTATGVERVVVTDEQGGFRVPALQPGPYTVESSCRASTPTPSKVVLTVGQVADLRVTLSVGAIQESVQVVGRGATVEIETTKSDLSAVVNQEQLSELPVLNRGFVGLAQLLPGGGPARSGDGRFGISTSFGGTNVRSMYSMQIDGGIMDHPIYGFAIVNVSQDAVQEFRVLRNQFDAEYSRAGTAVVNVVTRSGTNDLSGRLVLLRTRRLAQRQERLRAHQAGIRRRPAFSAAAGRPAGAQQGVPVRHLRVQPPELGADHRAAGHATRSPASSTASTTTAPGPSWPRRKLDYTANARHTLQPPLPLRQRRHHRGLRAGREHRARLLRTCRPTGTGRSAPRRSTAWSCSSWTRTRSASRPTPDTQVIRPSFTSGRSPNLPQGFPRKRYTVNDTFFWSTGRHSTKFGVRMAFEDLDYLADYYGAGVWQFNTDRPFARSRSAPPGRSASPSAAVRRPATTGTPNGASSPRTTCGSAT